MNRSPVADDAHPISISTTPIIQRWLVVASSTVAELVLIGKQPPSRETLDIFVESVCYHNALMTVAKSEEAGSRWEVSVGALDTALGLVFFFFNVCGSYVHSRRRTADRVCDEE